MNRPLHKHLLAGKGNLSNFSFVVIPKIKA
jgi:hypothetical protein